MCHAAIKQLACVDGLKQQFFVYTDGHRPQKLCTTILDIAGVVKGIQNLIDSQSGIL